MNTGHSGRPLVCGVTLVLIVALSLGAASVALALPPPVDPPQSRPTLTPVPLPTEPRPTLTPAPTESATAPAPTVGPTVPPAAGVPSAPGSGCESICGWVLNLADSSGVSGIVVRFRNTNWAVDAQTDNTGYYGYGRLGLDVGLLNVVLGEGSDLHPVTHDIAFAPPPGQTVLINLGVYRGRQALYPVLVPVASVSPEWVNRGEQAVFTVQVHNALDTAISDVWVTDLLPVGLNLSGVSSDRGDVIRSGNYAAVHTGGLGAGEVMTVTVYADVGADAPGGALDNTISLIYSEQAAAQATVRLHVQPAASVPVAIPVTGYGLSVFGAGVGLGLALWVVRRLRLRRSDMTQEGKQSS